MATRRSSFDRRRRRDAARRAATRRAAPKIRLPQVRRRRAAEAVLINTPGGLTGGDRMSVASRPATGRRAIVTTQACERVYRSAGGDRRGRRRGSRSATGARLDWLPQETILFDGARARPPPRRRPRRRRDAPRLSRAVLLGREAMGETLRARAASRPLAHPPRRPAGLSPTISASTAPTPRSLARPAAARRRRRLRDDPPRRRRTPSAASSLSAPRCRHRRRRERLERQASSRGSSRADGLALRRAHPGSRHASAAARALPRLWRMLGPA